MSLLLNFVTTRAFWWYHTLANNQCLKIPSPHNYFSKVWWFRIFVFCKECVMGTRPSVLFMASFLLNMSRLKAAVEGPARLYGVVINIKGRVNTFKIPPGQRKKPFTCKGLRS
ncbi:unnamed protein product [Eretmochelys imbricata]